MAKKPSYEELEQRIKKIKKELLEQSSLESALRESEELLKATIESAVDGMSLIKMEKSVLLTNDLHRYGIFQMNSSKPGMIRTCSGMF
ncbi:MAG: hypothetical protein OEV45_00625 [Desulfobacteraceae bacterium]|nr:hypothetical protein [Desulfobacteraceae bacterium]